MFQAHLSHYVKYVLLPRRKQGFSCEAERNALERALMHANLCENEGSQGI